ncbi:hypothetical protein CANCADRAFT_146499 [Tortispora caseinolytica NRRL Y-17796]|uniref:Small-subunit processome Utp12 domain-containing protein n=1 Tax=Tortispora caseinolytica NRRL Y-17796 TaxID=767744 RepID=A0A1E4T9M4_9ASCO|nr:hypothetical protein CANCADRAFT_146499 [Tortispora caseinolytica NRRL Y-17796]
MKTNFHLSNLLGTVYKQGNLVFVPDGKGILSPVGNRVSYFDLVGNRSYTFAYEHRKNISCIALNPQATLLLSVDIDGRGILVNFVTRAVLYHFNFKQKVTRIEFSPDGTVFAAATGRHIEVWKTPVAVTSVSFAPFIRHRIYTGHYDDVVHIQWSADSRFFLTASKDLSARIYSLHTEDVLAAAALYGHREPLVAAFFSDDQETIYTLSQDGALFVWNYVQPEVADDDMHDDEIPATWSITDKHYFNRSSKIVCAAFRPTSNMLVTGFADGVFSLVELPAFSTFHTISVSQHNIDSVAINSSGEWLAFGASKLGQLLVWEWQSESYILKQQGHYDAMSALVYSPDGSKLITASDDGKVKVWDTVTGFSIVTFSEHSSAVTALAFSKRGDVVFTASLDGSIRAYDLIRYRNFRTFTAPDRVQFSSLAVDPSGEIVCAGSLNNYDIHVWSVQTGQYLDSLQGHEGPVVSLAFGDVSGILASGSWDRTVRLWNVFSRAHDVEPIQMSSDVLAIDMRPDSKELAVSTLDGQIVFYDVAEGKQMGMIDGRKDIAGGRHSEDRFTAKNSSRAKFFSTIAYSPDGSCIIGGGNANYVCLYDIASSVLVKQYTVSMNMQLQGTQKYLNSSLMTEAGPIDSIDTTGDASDLEDRIDNTLPGATRGDLSKRKTQPAIRVSSVRFDPTGRSFAVCATEGLLIYSLDNILLFDPFDLDITVSPASTLEVLKEKNYIQALVMAFRLNEDYLIRQVCENIPYKIINLIAQSVPVVYLENFLQYIGKEMETTHHVEFYLLWIKALFVSHGPYIRSNRSIFTRICRKIQQNVTGLQKDIVRPTDENIYTLRYISA